MTGTQAKWDKLEGCGDNREPGFHQGEDLFIGSIDWREWDLMMVEQSRRRKQWAKASGGNQPGTLEGQLWASGAKGAVWALECTSGQSKTAKRQAFKEQGKWCTQYIAFKAALGRWQSDSTMGRVFTLLIAYPNSIPSIP